MILKKLLTSLTVFALGLSVIALGTPKAQAMPVITAFYDFEGSGLDRFDDPAGATADDLNGQFNPAFSVDVSGINGGSQSASFNGNSALFTDSFTADLAPDPNAMTIMFWVKGDDPTQENNNIRLMTSRVRPNGSGTTGRSWQVEGFGQGNGNGMDVRYQPHNGVYPQNWFSPDATNALAGPNEQAVWHHVAFVLANSGHPGDGGAYGQTFVDGIQVGGTYNPNNLWDGHTLANLEGQFLIGGHSETAGSRAFTGLLDDVALFGGIVSDEDILAIARGTLSPGDFIPGQDGGVPEPATATLALLGLGGLMMRRRRNA
jgi:hypothetical protein